MPSYITNGATLISLSPGEIGLSFNAENPPAPQAGQQFYLSSPQGRGLLGFSVECQWSAAPVAAVVNIQVADNDADASYITVDTLTFGGSDVTLRSDPAGLSPRYVRVQLASHTGSETLTARILPR